MSHNIYYHRYVLKSANPLNALTHKREVEGCLIRIGSGVGCIQPWVELGDESLDQQLDALRAANPCCLGKRAMACALMDGMAREKGMSLFEGLTIPDSHLTVVPGMDLATEEVNLFSRIKFKGTTHLDETREQALQCIRQAPGEFQIRIDFNEGLEHSSAMNLRQALGAEVCQRVEFIEDPTRFDDENWSRLSSQTGLPLAVDRSCEQALENESELKWWIIKPAVVDSESVCSKLESASGSRNLVVTSYMDHAIGQMYAAYEAALIYSKYPNSVKECGLLTHQLFEPDVFFESIQSRGPMLKAPDGSGLGFDDQLSDLPWRRL